MDCQAETKRIVVGLGNPGRRYAQTRHNVGWMVLAALRRRWQVDAGRSAFSGLLYQARPAGPDGQARPVMVFEPLTYVNRSGEAVCGLVAFYKVSCSDLLVVLDDMALPVGRLRIRTGGSSGGHNGLENILGLLGTQEVPRLRIGIGQPPGQTDSVDYVLGRFETGELEMIQQAIELAADAVEDWIACGINYVMDKYNRKQDAPEAPQKEA